MSDKKFILQGLTTNTHVDAIKRIFEVPEIQQVILSIAFISEEGVLLLEEELKIVSDKTKVFAGIRNDITSQQGLLRLLKLGTTLYTVDTGARNIVFHPKIYLAKGATEARLVIGSANLTLGGLNNNIEAGMAMDFDLTNISERELVESIENEFLKLPSSNQSNITLITSEEQLELLKQSGRILDELEVLPPRPTVKGVRPSSDVIPRIKLRVPRKYRTIKKTRVNLSAQRPTTNFERTGIGATSANKNSLKLFWESKPLEERDLNIPSGINTHATGSMSLDKGLLAREGDHRHYFRDEVFSHLPWTPTNKPHIEESQAEFELIIKGISYGKFTLKIGHNTDTTSASYAQRNVMTNLKWGDAKEYITQRDLIGRTLSLYRNEENPTLFFLEID